MGVPGRPARWSPSWMEVFWRSAVGIVVLTTPFRARRPGSALSGGGCWGVGGCCSQFVAGLQRAEGVHTGAHHGIPGVTTLSRRALLCFRGGFLSRRRSRSRSSPGPGSSVGRGPAASLGGWFVGGLRRRRLPARWRTLRVNSHRGWRSWLSTSIGGAGAFAGVGSGGGRACDGPVHLERKRGEVARALISAPVGESGLYATAGGLGRDTLCSAVLRPVDIVGTLHLLGGTRG
jgi:hypothetical protein